MARTIAGYLGKGFDPFVLNADPNAPNLVWYVFSAKGAGSCKLAVARKSFLPKRALNPLGSKADSVEPKAKKPGSLSDH